MYVRVCRDCGEEYRPDIARCADCGGELFDRYEGEDGVTVVDSAPPAPEAPPAEAASVESVYPLYSGSIPDLEPMSEALRAEKVPCRIGRLSHAFVLGVAEPDLERALAVLKPFRGRASELGVTEYDYEAREEGQPQSCPACGAAVEGLGADCPECGLHLRAPAEEAEPPREEGD
jgi:uncharacterized OB-fold protein